MAPRLGAEAPGACQRRIPLTGADRQPVLPVSDLPAYAGVRAVAQAISGGSKSS
jgi:hypothetical protein